MRHYLNHGSADEPKLRVYLNLDNLADLRPDTLWPELEGDERMARLRADGFDGVQVTSGEPPSPGVMPFCGLGDHRPSHQQLRKLPGNGVRVLDGDFRGVWWGEGDFPTAVRGALLVYGIGHGGRGITAAGRISTGVEALGQPDICHVAL